MYIYIKCYFRMLKLGARRRLYITVQITVPLKKKTKQNIIFLSHKIKISGTQ